MGIIKKAQRVAASVIGMNDNAATNKVLKAGCAVRFIVLEGKACGRNANVSNQDVCLFSDENGRVTRAVVGSKGIYQDPEYVSLEQRGEVHA
jgi:hypothetical protein